MRAVVQDCTRSAGPRGRRWYRGRGSTSASYASGVGHRTPPKPNRRQMDRVSPVEATAFSRGTVHDAFLDKIPQLVGASTVTGLHGTKESNLRTAIDTCGRIRRR